ncbi:MAG: tetratricopeptide repeat protein [Planctomycetota bacterium]
MATRKLPKKETLGRYRIIREIGRGGSGVVYEGWDPKENRQVAVKVLPAIRALDGDRVERFLREARNARHLEHEHIVSLYEIGEERGTYFLVMQYVEGRPLDVFWKEELIDFREAVNVVLQCLEALEYAHGRDLVHLDVKPQNILVDRRGRAYLTDFGLAQGVATGRAKGTVVGTPKYMSPEQASGSARVNFQSDIYSLGVTLYNLLTYTHPFEGDDVHIILRNVISGDFPRPRDINNRIPARLEAIVLKAMERKPSRRYGSDAEFRADLENYLKGESVTASVPIMKRRGLRLVGNRRVLYAVLAFAVLSVGVLIALEFLGSAPSATHTATADDPEKRREARKLSDEGDRHFQEGRLDEALRDYIRALKLMPRDPITLVKRGQIYTRQSALERAEADFTKAIEFQPDFGLAWLCRGQTRIERRNLAGAADDLRTSLKILRGKTADPESADLLSKNLTALGQLRLKDGDVAGARAHLEEALRHTPRNPRAHLFLGLAHLEAGERTLAFEEIKKVTELEPTDTEAKRELELLKRGLVVAGQQEVQITILRAIAHLEQGKHSQAIQFCEGALKIEPANVEALLLRARARMALGEAEEALADIDAALAQDRDRHVVLAWRARAEILLGRHGEAAADARSALAVQPGFPEALRELGIALASLGNDGEARRVLEQAVARLPGDGEVLRTLARLHLEAGRFEPALSAAGRVLETSPHDAAASEISARANLALGREAEALRDAERALVSRPGLPQAHLVKARVLLSRGDPEGALASAKAAAKGKGTRVSAWRVQLEALDGLGMTGERLRVCDRLLDALPGDPEALEVRGSLNLEAGNLKSAERDYRALCEAKPDSADALLGLARTLMRAERPLEAYFSAEKAADKGAGVRAEAVMGWALLHQKRYRGALGHLETALAAMAPDDPERGDVLLRTARTLRALGRAGEALIALSGVKPNSGRTPVVGRLEAEVLLDLGKADEGEEAVTRLNLAAGPESRWLQARLLLLRGEPEKALGIFQALERKVSAGPGWVALFQGLCLRELGRPAEALPLFEEAVRRDPHLARALLERGKALGEAGRKDAFLADLDAVVQGNPRDGGLRLLRAEVALAFPARRAEAMADLGIAADLLPDEPRVFELRSRAHLEAGDLEGALADLDRLQMLAPARWDVDRMRAETLEKLHRYAEAATAWARAVRFKEGRNHDLTWKVFRAWVLAGQFEKVLEGFGKVELTEPWRGRMFLLRGEAEMRLGRHAKAIETAGEVLRREPSRSLEAKCLRAEAYILRGALTGRGVESEDFVKAYFDIQAYYPQAKRGEPPDAAQRARVFTVMGLYQLVAEVNTERAVEDFRAAVKAWDGARDAHRRLGRLAAQGKGGVGELQGLVYLDRARQLAHPDAVGILLDRGRCFQELGRVGEAVKAYREALTRDPENAEARKRLGELEKG